MPCLNSTPPVLSLLRALGLQVPSWCESQVIDAGSTCCGSGLLDTAGNCCLNNATLDSTGQCCSSGQLDACGVCDGTAKFVDVVGSCCATALDANGLCCAGSVDECGVCGGQSTSCGISLELGLTVNSSLLHGSGVEVSRAMCSAALPGLRCTCGDAAGGYYMRLSSLLVVVITAALLVRQSWLQEGPIQDYLDTLAPELEVSPDSLTINGVSNGTSAAEFSTAEAGSPPVQQGDGGADSVVVSVTLEPNTSAPVDGQFTIAWMRTQLDSIQTQQGVNSTVRLTSVQAVGRWAALEVWM